jgi:hypothetical protein
LAPISTNAELWSSVDRVGGRLDAIGQHDLSKALYNAMYTSNVTGEELEATWFALQRIMESGAVGAQVVLDEIRDCIAYIDRILGPPRKPPQP